jgi:hypothetical protein
MDDYDIEKNINEYVADDIINNISNMQLSMVLQYIAVKTHIQTYISTFTDNEYASWNAELIKYAYEFAACPHYLKLMKIEYICERIELSHSDTEVIADAIIAFKQAQKGYQNEICKVLEALEQTPMHQAYLKNITEPSEMDIKIIESIETRIMVENIVSKDTSNIYNNSVKGE